MALIELVDYNEIYTSGDAVAEKKSTRRRGSKAKKADDTPAVGTKAAPKAENEEVVEAAPVVEESQVEEAQVEETTTEETSAPAEESSEEEKKGE
jgi:large subunit ribosomal protein L17